LSGIILPTQQLEIAKRWLREQVFPLWSAAGHDAAGFVESLDSNGKPTNEVRRALVQSRQIFSFRVGQSLGYVDVESAKKLIINGASALINRYRLPTGAYMRSVTVSGDPSDASPDLYTQAFSLFGFAHAFAATGNTEYRQKSLEILKYLNQERRHGGGFTEIEKGQIVFRSNPHMHLFEAALAWQEADPGTIAWAELAQQIATHCLNYFIDQKSGLLAEDFDEDWRPRRVDGNFVWEPGHQYEWSWLLGLRKHAPLSVREKLFLLSERDGLSKERGMAWDSMWSNGQPQLRSSRFWPQCERIKAAMQLALENLDASAGYAKVADQAVAALFKFFPAQTPALWRDTLDESGQFDQRPSKSSSLYHIIGALDLYIRLRPQITGS
jgi:mannose/cellobiose epimerase-like protein (N-acyl-D-glucosamine 2-epimerase family)